MIGASTISAVNSYQKAKGLPVDQYLSIDTLKSLGINPSRSDPTPATSYAPCGRCRSQTRSRMTRGIARVVRA